MLKRYLLTNLIAIPYHLFLMFMVIFGSLMGAPNIANWLASFTTVITVFFFMGLTPNIFVFVKYIDEKYNISSFCISSISLYFTYFIIINTVGYFIIH